jgi:hypothetical protein
VKGAGEAPEMSGSAYMADLYVEKVSTAGAKPHLDLVWIGFDEWEDWTNLWDESKWILKETKALVWMGARIAS